MKKIRIGHPLDPATEIGPLIHPRHVEKVLSYVSAARDAGATVAVGGGRANGGKGNFVEPTLYLNARNEMKIAQEEIFGPVLCVIPFDSDDEAIKIANDSIYGLGGGVWSKNVDRAHTIAAAMRTGTVWVNDYHMITPTRRKSLGPR